MLMILLLYYVIKNSILVVILLHGKNNDFTEIFRNLSRYRSENNFVE